MQISLARNKFFKDYSINNRWLLEIVKLDRNI